MNISKTNQVAYRRYIKNSMNKFILPVLLGSIVLSFACGEKNGSNASGSKLEGKTEKLGNLIFMREKKAAYARAKKENKPILIDFYATWCVNCKLWSKLVLKNKKLNGALQKIVLLKIYDTDPAFAVYRKRTNFQELNVGLPFFVVLNPDGTFRWKSQNFRDTAGMIAALQAKNP